MIKLLTLLWLANTALLPPASKFEAERKLVLAAINKTQQQARANAGMLCSMHYRVCNNLRKIDNKAIIRTEVNELKTTRHNYNTCYRTAELQIFSDSSLQFIIVPAQKMVIVNKRKKLPAFSRVDRITYNLLDTQKKDLENAPVYGTIDSTLEGAPCKLVIFQRVLPNGEPKYENLFGYIIDADTVIRATWQMLPQNENTLQERIMHIKSRTYEKAQSMLPARLNVFTAEGRLKPEFKGYKVIRK
ncbi:MAG: hypothetical protein V4543_16240 [Bacteroidota bacterium]